MPRGQPRPQPRSFLNRGTAPVINYHWEGFTINSVTSRRRTYLG
ncbi:EamA/RhaT family transporter, partial [Lactobacillus fermentum]|nr:EamA/RhaT family transporter [Limosilactobacillus fermentum]